MRSKLWIGAAVVAALVVGAPSAWAHCQIPCGIYGDETRFVQLEEHVTTIEKSMKQIAALGAESSRNYNQIVRWVNSKETHADELSEIVTYYFMTQRIKPIGPDDAEAHKKYVKELRLLHGMLVHAMKAKQTTDLEHVAQLRDLIAKFKTSYLGEHGHAH